MLSRAFGAVFVWLLFGLRGPRRPTRLLVGVAEVGAIACRLVPVLGALFAVAYGGRTVLVRVPGVAAQAVAQIGEPVSLLGAKVTLIGTFNQNIDAGIGLDGIHRAQHRVPVALTLVGFLVASVGSAVTPIDPPVTPIGSPVTPIDSPVTPIGLSVAPVRRQVPQSTSIAVVSGVVALTGRPVARLTGNLPVRRDVAVQVRGLIAPLRRFLTFLRRLSRVGPNVCLLVGKGSLHVVCPFCGDPVPLVGDVVASVCRPVSLVGDTATLISHAVTFVGGALPLAFLRLGGHRASLPCLSRLVPWP